MSCPEISALKVARDKIESGEFIYLCTALERGVAGAHSGYPPETKAAALRLIEAIERAFSAAGIAVRGCPVEAWLMKKGIPGHEIYTGDMKQYRLDWIDKWVAGIEGEVAE